MALIDFDTAKLHLRADDSDAEDTTIAIYLGAAERDAANYLGRKIYATQEELDAALVLDPTDTGIVLNETITAAILLTLGHLFENRASVDTVQKQELPLGVKSLLQHDRIGLGV